MVEPNKKVKFSDVKYQYLTVLAVNTISLCHGFAVGWLSAAVPILKSVDTSLRSGPLTVEQTMWLGGVYPLGGFFGNFIFGILGNYFGRVTTISLLALPNFVFWLTVLFANNFTQLVVGRFIGGLSGGLFVCVPLFVTEIANKEIRGFLGLMGPLIVTVGILMAYICGAFVEYRTVPYCFMGFPVLLNAERSLIFYNNGNRTGDKNYDVKNELEKLKSLVKQKEELRKTSSVKLILEKKALKALFLGVSLVAISIFSGIVAMTMHAAQLFIDSGAVFDANLSAIILGVLQVCGTYASSVLVDRVGRRILLGVSSFGAALALFVFGTFSYLNLRGFDLTSVDWIPVVSASFYIFINCAGVKPMPFLYIAEILPENVRNVGVSICMMSLTLFSSVTVFTLPLLVELFDLYAVMWTYGCICVLGILFSIFVMNETKGKNVNKLLENVKAAVISLRNENGVYSECIKHGDIAITFDDGTSSNTEAVLDVLKELRVHATFFVNGVNFENINDQATHDKMRRIVQEGHQLGSHTWSHIDLTANQTLETIKKEMLDLENKVQEILGFKMSIMRPPYGRFNDSVLEIIHVEMNYSVIMWNLDTVDWENGADTNKSFQAYVDEMEYSTNLNSSFIALHHDFADGSAALARRAIEYVVGKGFHPVTISECIGIPDNYTGAVWSIRQSVSLMLLCIVFIMKT
ncbi:Facilitated trehalose transporter Tret1 [Pseudolycoriella hygida]|uniref:Facilitated trehalose transporter Tret1 n=1 Tax=Pseudolycoriella hygida TaxID=35572 RepID=A0A9Q0N1V2_9DIPT|nr:Facilitated trehalose transporter Tret1 [Pseudolycoriella hygida]